MQLDGESPLIADYSGLRRPSYQDMQSPLTCQDQQNLGADYPEPDRLLVDSEQEANTMLPSPIAPSRKNENWSEPNPEDVAEYDDCGSSRNGKRWKAAHRAVERRYRSNLNLKIIKLGQCIPTIRDQAIALEDLENGEDCRLAPKAKLQKGYVLSKAVEYIQSLQQRASELEAENKQLEGRFRALHMVEEEGDETSPGMSDGRPSPGIARRHSEQTPNLSVSRPRVKLGVEVTSATNGTEIPLSGTQNYFLPPQSEFSFVSEHPSLALKQPRVTRREIARMLSA